MPPEQGIGLDEVKGIAPGPVETRELDHEKSVAATDRRPAYRAAYHDQLLAQQCVLGNQFSFRGDKVLDDAGHDPSRRWLKESLDESAAEFRQRMAADLAVMMSSLSMVPSPALVVYGRPSMATEDGSRYLG